MEVLRGTPLLVQIFFVYFVLPSVGISFSAWVAGVAALGVNASAYIAEVCRAGVLSVDRGQPEAARSLGMTAWQSLRFVVLPQALRRMVPPLTNEAVALLKDSSLVSVLTVMELTKQTQIFATNLGSWVLPGSLCALLYLAMSLPLAALARRLERGWKMPTA